MTKNARRTSKYKVGWNEHIDLPDWGILDLRAKMDSGARSSSLDVDHIEFLPNGKVRFNVVLSKRKEGKCATVVTEVSRIAKVKASPTHQENRIFVKTVMKLGPVKKIVEINLVDRANMVYRMLVGRTALKDHFLVDVSHSRILTGAGTQLSATRAKK